MVQPRDPVRDPAENRKDDNLRLHARSQIDF